VDKEAILALLDQVGEEMKEKFTKAYSNSRLEQLFSQLGTLKMIVESAHDEAEREETQERKDGVAQQMVLGGRSMTDAKDAVERGER
jgi:hypothetical protein